MQFREDSIPPASRRIGQEASLGRPMHDRSQSRIDIPAGQLTIGPSRRAANEAFENRAFADPASKRSRSLARLSNYRKCKYLLEASGNRGLPRGAPTVVTEIGAGYDGFRLTVESTHSR
jgi:hypothetical protein